MVLNFYHRFFLSKLLSEHDSIIFSFTGTVVICFIFSGVHSLMEQCSNEELRLQANCKVNFNKILKNFPNFPNSLQVRPSVYDEWVGKSSLVPYPSKNYLKNSC